MRQMYRFCLLHHQPLDVSFVLRPLPLSSHSLMMSHVTRTAVQLLLLSVTVIRTGKRRNESTTIYCQSKDEEGWSFRVDLQPNVCILLFETEPASRGEWNGKLNLTESHVLLHQVNARLILTRPGDESGVRWDGMGLRTGCGCVFVASYLK